MKFRETISKEEIRNIEKMAHFPGKLHLIDKLEDVAPAIKELKKAKVVGFDTETKAIFHRTKEKPQVALIQISTLTDAYLFRTNIIGFPEELDEFIASPQTLKIGLSLRDDYKVMRGRTDVEPQGFVELQKLCPGYGIKDMGLQRIYAIIFDERISKSQRLTNWEAPVLTEKQMMYAALDAYACARIYARLMEEEKPEPYEFALL